MNTRTRAAAPPPVRSQGQRLTPGFSGLAVMATLLTTVGALGATPALAQSAAAVPAVPSTSVDPGQFVSAPTGTVFRYHRISSGSFGTYDGPVVWTLGQRDWNGQRLMSFISATHGGSLHDPVTHGLVLQLTPAGEPGYAYQPPIAYPWPLKVGQAWTSTHEMSTFKPPAVRPLTLQFKVEALEEITVPAGRYTAYRIVQRNSFGEVEQLWSVPSKGIATLKRIVDRPASHPMGAGHLEAELTGLKPPVD